MLADFLPQILIVIGIGGGLAILIRRSRSLSDEELKFFHSESHLRERISGFWTHQVVEKFPKQELEEKTLLFVEKTLRRSRILVIRIDTFLSRIQERVQAMRKNQVLDPGYWVTLKDSHQRDGAGKYNGDQLLDPAAEEERLRKSAATTASAFVNLARLYLAGHHYTDARRTLLVAWRLDPDDRAVLTLLRDIRAQEKTKEAVPTSQEL